MKKIILQADAPLIAQAVVATRALDDGRPETAQHGIYYRIYESEGKAKERWVAVYNKQSITIYPQK